MANLLLGGGWKRNRYCDGSQHLQRGLVPAETVRRKSRDTHARKATLMACFLERYALRLYTGGIQFLGSHTAEEHNNQIAYRWTHYVDRAEHHRSGRSLPLRAGAQQRFHSGECGLSLWCCDHLAATAHLLAGWQEQHNWPSQWYQL